MDKLPSGNWRAKPIINGKRMSFTAPTQREVKEKIEAYIIAQKERKVYQDDPLVRDIIADYIDSKRGVLSPSTIREYVRLQNKVFTSINELHLSDVDSKTLQYFISEISEGRSGKSVRNIYGLLNAALSQVSDHRYKVSLPMSVKPELPVPDKDQVQLLLDNAKSEELTLAMLLAAFGTLRRGEICAVKYKDIRREERSIRIHADMVLDEDNHWFYKPYPKTAKGVRVIQYPDKVFDRIPVGDPEDFVVPLTPNALYKRFYNARKHTTLTCNLHSLRKYAASFMHALGIPDKYIMEVGGWSDDRVLKNVYENVLTEQQKTFNNKRIEYLNNNFDL